MPIVIPNGCCWKGQADSFIAIVFVATGTATDLTGYTQCSLESDSAAERRNLHEGKKSVAAP
jgi:hypothetical protein